MILLKAIWMTAAAFMLGGILLWLALLVSHSLAKRRDRRLAAHADLWLERVIDVLDGREPPEHLPHPRNGEEMEAVIGLLRELADRFRGTYAGRMVLVLEKIGAAGFGLKLLGSKLADNRVRGCALLGWCGADGRVDEALEKTLEDKHSRVVLEAASALVRRHAVKDILPVVRALCRSRAAKSLLARDLFRRWGEAESKDWSGLLDEHWTEDGWILLLEAAGATGRGEWTPRIARLTKHASPDVIRAALAALASLGDPQGADAAERCCHHDRWQVRRDAVAALAACADPRQSHDLFLKLLGDESFEVRREAIQALIRSGGGEKLRALTPADDWQRGLFREAGIHNQHVP